MFLVIEKDVRFQRFQNAPFIHAAKKMGLINGDVPAAQSVDDSAVRRRTIANA